MWEVEVEGPTEELPVVSVTKKIQVCVKERESVKR